MSKPIIFGYDVVSYNGPIPNCLNPKYLNTIYQASDFYFENSGEGFSKRWNIDWPVYNSNFYNKISENKSVYEIIKDKKNENNYDWFYIVEPFGSIESFFGTNPNQDFCLKFMSSIAINEIKNGNGKLFFNYIIDGGLGINLKNFQKIISFLKENEIPDEKVYFIFQDFKLKENFKNIGLNYNVLDFNLALISKSEEFNKQINDPNWNYWGNGSHEPQVGKIESKSSGICTYTEYENNIKTDKKDFLLFNRHWKLHRLLLLSQLHKLGLETNLVSWDNSFYNEHIVHEFLKYDENLEFADLLKNESKIIDVPNLTKIAGYGFESKEPYIQTYISIVTESIFFQNLNGDNEFQSGYLSEKIWKPIGHCQPFILAAPPKSLQYIRKRFGFKTFHPFIDESYDLETDDFKRLEMIKIEILKFANKSKEDKILFLNEVKDIVKYNQQRFLDFGKDYRFELAKVINFLLNTSKSLI